MKLDEIKLNSALCSAVAQKSWCEKGSLLMMLHLCCIVKCARAFDKCRYTAYKYIFLCEPDKELSGPESRLSL